MVNTFDDLRNLTDNWNDYGARPLVPAYIDYAEDLYKLLPSGFEIFPLADGGVQIEFEDSLMYVEFVVEDKLSLYWFRKETAPLTEGEDTFAIEDMILAAKFANVLVKNKAERVATEIFGEMRNTTEEENKAVNEYIKSISEPTGVNFADFYDKKREDYISWDEYFMGVALLAAQRSKDPNTQVGACIVGEDRVILSTGYNGLPKGCSDDDFPWCRKGEHTKYEYVAHAELNAILNNKGKSLRGATLYVSLFPCNECAKAIIQSGIKEIVYLSDKYDGTPSDIASKMMLNAAGVKYRKFESDKKLTVNFAQ